VWRLLALTLTLAACSADAEPRWTAAQAESIERVRGTPVNEPRCRGLGEVVDERFERFSCRAGARRATETYDTVAVLYDVIPEDEYEGPDSAHRLENVSFVGGPGIP
jgi:hypothetical protein